MSCTVFEKQALTDFEYRRLLNLIVTTGGLESRYINNIRFPLTVESEKELDKIYTINNVNDIVTSGRLNDAIARVSDNRASFTDKEYIICDMFGFYKDDNPYSYDALLLSDNRAIEIKSERWNKNSKLNCKATFSDIKPHRLDAWSSTNPLIYQCGYVYEKLYYVLEFEYKYIADFLYTQLGKKNGTYDAGDLLKLNVPIKVKYLVSPKISQFQKYISKNFLKLFTQS